jgi:hypothetical protein
LKCGLFELNTNANSLQVGFIANALNLKSVKFKI